jgi:hypothetical protein
VWPEVRKAVKAIRAAMKVRPEPQDPDDADLVFLTTTGQRWVWSQGNIADIDAANIESLTHVSRVDRVTVDPSQVLGDHQVHLAAGNQVFGLTDGGPIGEHAAGLFAQQRDLHGSPVDVAQVVLDVSVRGFDVLDVLMHGGNAAEGNDPQRTGGGLGNERCSNHGHGTSPINKGEQMLR